MNVCFVNSTNKWGGVKSWTLDVALGLAGRGHGITIVGRPGPFVDKAREMGFDALGLSFGPDFNPLLVSRFLGMFRAGNTDLVVVNVGKDMRSAGVAARILGIPVVHRVGLAGDMLDTWKVRLLHKWVRPAVLVPCEQIKAGMLQELPYLKPEEVTVVLTGKEPAPAPPAGLHSPLRFVSTSQLNSDKGHRDILEALAELKKRGYAFFYDVAGTGRIERELKETASRLELDDRVVWHGFQKDVRAILRQADVFLLPSRSEGLPNTLLEAMAEGLVCLARDIGGVRECWPAEARRLLLPRNAASDAFMTALQGILQTAPDRLLETGRMFWEHATANSRQRMTGQVETFFRSCLGPAPAGKQGNGDD